MRKLTFILCLLFTISTVKADEGMWILKELNQMSAARMKELGFKFPIDSLYSEANPSLKDAVVIFGEGCTGVAVSKQGLIFTNHHCGYSSIQQLSSVEHDYLKNGFASNNFGAELPAPGLIISFLKSTEDITDYVLSHISNTDDETKRQNIVDSLSVQILKQDKYKGNFTKAQVIPFYTNNKYYVVVYEVFRDVRLVFTPPSSVGKFGGETDNWMWPRHTGDFSVFRVYADKDNKPANYSSENVPYQPKYSVPVSLKGYKAHDYSMTIGYPGRTQRYMSSWGIEQMVESTHKPRIDVRGAKQSIWKAAMNADDAIRIKYASKYASSSNYWKNAIGMNSAIQKLNVIGDKVVLEKQFKDWVNKDSGRIAEYGSVLENLQNGYIATMNSTAYQTYFSEIFYNGIEIIRFANTFKYIMDNSSIQDKAETLESRLTKSYKDYEPELDKKLMPVLLQLYAEHVPQEYLPSVYTTINKKFKGDYQKYADWFYSKTNFTDLNKLIAFAKKTNKKDVDKDPAIELAQSLDEIVNKINSGLIPYKAEIKKGERLLMKGLMEMQPDKAFYPDANFTQRLSYGSIGGYKPADAVTYNYFTTSNGILQKTIPNNPEFGVQQYILDKLAKGDFGQYADEDGSLHVDFLSNNDITGGNSGSPMFNGNAELIGLAFDGNWESLSGDILFEPELQRCIGVDIRYVLYTIDKVMGCTRLIDELNIVK